MLVRRRITDADVRGEAGGAVVRAGQIEVGSVALSGGVVARVVERDHHLAGHCVDCEPVVEPVDGERESVADRPRRRPGRAAVARGRQENVGPHVAYVHPRTIQAPAVWTGGSVRVASGVHERAPAELRRDSGIEGNRLGRDDDLRREGGAAVERAGEGDGVRCVIVPGYVQLAVRTDERDRPDGTAGSVRLVGAGHAETGAGILGSRDQHTAARCRAASCGVPGNVDAVAEGRARGAVSGDHWLVVEVIGATREPEERRLRPGTSAVGGARDRHLCAVDPVAVTEEHDDVSVEEVPLRVEGQRRVGAEIDAIGPLGRRQR